MSSALDLNGEEKKDTEDDKSGMNKMHEMLEQYAESFHEWSSLQNQSDEDEEKDEDELNQIWDQKIYCTHHSDSNKIQAIAGKYRVSHDIFIQNSKTYKYEWNSAPIDDTNVMCSVADVAR